MIISHPDQRTAEYNLYFRLMSEGLTTRDVVEFRDEMEQLAIHAVDPKLRQKAAQEIDRYGRGHTATAANGG